jgi:hypothetical protein
MDGQHRTTLLRRRNVPDHGVGESRHHVDQSATHTVDRDGEGAPSDR